MTIGECRALVRKARADGYMDAYSSKYGYAVCPQYLVWIGIRGFNTRKEYEKWKEAKEVKP